MEWNLWDLQGTDYIKSLGEAAELNGVELDNMEWIRSNSIGLKRHGMELEVRTQI